MINKRKRRYGERRSSKSWLMYILLALFILLFIWLITALVQSKNPIDLLRNSFKGSPESGEIVDTRDQGLLQKIQDQEKTIDSLKNKILVLQGLDSMAKAVVRVNSNQLNVRTSPSIAAPLSFKISPNEEVFILEYDSQQYVLDGKSGSWVKILYKGSEGWVWGNYIEKLVN